ncbi:MAG: hypothetical protein GY870_12400 [archaeon]|nr:hypothetical protein [archaeon]
MPIDVDSLKKKHGQDAKVFQKKPPLVKKAEEENPFADSPKTIYENSRDLKEKRELIRKIFDDNTDLPVEDMLMHYFTQGDGKKMGKTVSPLKGIREGLEDMLNIQQLKDLVQGFRTIKEQPKNEEEDMSDNNQNLMTMLPLFQKMQGGNGQIDPMMMMMLMNGMGGGQKQGNNMGQLFLMMSMLNMNTNQQQQQQSNPNGTPVQPNQANNAEMIKSIYQELQNVMNQQQQKPTIDPMTLMMMQSINKSNQSQNNGGQNIEVLLDKFNTMMQNNQTNQMAMIMQSQNDKFERGMEMIAGALHRDRPEEKILNNFQLFRELTGDKREKNVHEMEYDLKKQELGFKEAARRDMLDREERAQVRDGEKSNRIMDTASTVLDKVIGNGLGQLVGDLMSAKKPKAAQLGRAEGQQSQDFDSSLLDDL